jgi:hypothetical protein
MPTPHLGILPMIPHGMPVNIANQICFATVLFCGIATGQAPSAPSAYPYLLRLEHSNFEGHSCALLQNSGIFHLEVSRGDEVKVFEGTIATNNLQEIEGYLNSNALADLSQQQIEEPLIRTRHDELQVTVFRGDGWQDLFFRSSDSQQPFKQWLQPLAHWLDTLQRLPRRELSEDEGKNNCLPPRVIALKTRDADIPQQPVTSKVTANLLYSGPAPQPQLSRPIKPQPVPTLLQLYSFEMKSETAHETCALVAENGEYRFEDRTQKTGKPVKAKIVAGQIRPDELQQLHQLLDDPALAQIKHHEPPGRGDVPMMGDKLDISISRPAGVQHFVLSSRFNRPGFPSFYGGDGDSSAARPLLKFLSEHVGNNAAGLLGPSEHNGCAEAR